MRFLGDSAKWGGGGVAFLDHHGGGPAAGRRYLITRGQFDDVAAQENGRESVALPLDDLEPGHVLAIGQGGWDGLLAFEPIDDIPIVTFTSPSPVDERPATAPSAAYLGTILRGLQEVHPLPVRELVVHVARSPGVAAGWTIEEMLELAAK